MSGVYFLIYKNKVVYIGQTQNFEHRLSSHKGKKNFDSCRFIPCDKEKLLMYESRWILRFQPEYNIRKKIKQGKRKSPLTIRMPRAMKEHISGFAKPNVNAWINKVLKKTSGYVTKGKLR